MIYFTSFAFPAYSGLQRKKKKHNTYQCTTGTFPHNQMVPPGFKGNDMRSMNQLTIIFHHGQLKRFLYEKAYYFPENTFKAHTNIILKIQGYCRLEKDRPDWQERFEGASMLQNHM